jgi:hypothetical protein
VSLLTARCCAACLPPPPFSGVEQGLEEDFLVAVELGVSSRSELTEAQLEYADRIKDKLARVGVHSLT